MKGHLSQHSSLTMLQMWCLPLTSKDNNHIIFPTEWYHPHLPSWLENTGNPSVHLVYGITATICTVSWYNSSYKHSSLKSAIHKHLTREFYDIVFMYSCGSHYMKWYCKTGSINGVHSVPLLGNGYKRIP